MRNADTLCCVIEFDLSESIEPGHKIGHEINQAVTEQFGNSAENILDSIRENLDMGTKWIEEIQKCYNLKMFMTRVYGGCVNISYMKGIMTQTELKNNIAILVLEINRLLCLNLLEHAKR